MYYSVLWIGSNWNTNIKHLNFEWHKNREYGWICWTIMQWIWIIRMNTVKIDPKSNWLKLPILSLLVVYNTQSLSNIFLLFYLFYLFVTLIVRVIQYSETIRFQSQLWKKSTTNNTINSDRRLCSFNTKHKWTMKSILVRFHSIHACSI